jgi:predicted RNase H-like HicB family nuclease
MGFNDPFRNYDAWLTTDRLGEAAEKAQERLDEAWSLTVEALGNEGYSVPEGAWEDDHPQHAIYEAWLAFMTKVDEHEQALEAAAEAEHYEETGTCDACGVDYPLSQAVILTEPMPARLVCPACAAL